MGRVRLKAEEKPRPACCQTSQVTSCPLLTGQPIPKKLRRQKLLKEVTITDLSQGYLLPSADWAAYPQETQKTKTS
ncbi:hypothetical protein RRG08_039312 [Elysia crispata]|uniref:Uncharacterized protein n=1 Tax=Elysia crispata TaxID=231223 RepID=A0AAE0YQS2_9GAST|nr:hypothetical protein RRG08_039312 [Elysia crispata]